MIIDKKLLFSLLNEQHPYVPKAFNETNVIINPPEAFDDNGRGEVNTRILLEAVEGSGYTGQAYVYFNSQHNQNIVNVFIETDLSWRYVIQKVNEIQNSKFTKDDFPDFDLTFDVLPASFLIDYDQEFLFGSSQFTVNVYLKGGLSGILKEKSIFPSIVTGIDIFPNISSINNNMYLYKVLNLETPIGGFVDKTLTPQLGIPNRRSVLLKSRLDITDISPSLNYPTPVVTSLPDQIIDVVLIPDIGLPEGINNYIGSSLLPELKLSPIISEAVITNRLLALTLPKINENSVAIINKHILPALQLYPSLSDLSEKPLNVSLEDQLKPHDSLNKVVNVSIQNQLRIKPPYDIANIKHSLLPEIHGYVSELIGTYVNRSLAPSLIESDHISTIITAELLPGLMKPIPDPAVSDSRKYLLPGLQTSKSLTEVMNENQYLKTIKE